MVLVITPAIVMIRLEKVLENINVNKPDVAVKLCRKYLAEFEGKSITVFTREDTNHFADELFEIELLITLGVFEMATVQLQLLNKKIVRILTNYNMVRNRLMSNDMSNDIGSLAALPNDILRDIVDKLQADYVW
jgi:hypothetical protein